MANEFKHKSQGTVLTQNEYENIDAHQFDSQATGDIMYASSATQLSRLGVGSNDDVLILSSGIPAWASTLAGLTLTSPVLNSPTLTLTNSTGAAPTTEAVIEWDSDDNEIVVGDGAATKYFSDDTKLLQVANDLSDLNNAATARTNLGVDAAGTDNSTDVTLAGTPDYITISGQEITRGLIVLTTDVSGTLPVGNGGTGATSLNDLITLGTHTTGNYVADITAGALIDVSGGGSETATVTVNVDLSELADMTVAEDGALDELVLLDSGVQKRKLISEINLSSFNDDLGYAAGDITAVTAGDLLTGGGTTGAVTLNVDLSALTDMTAAEVGTDELVILDASAQKRKAINEISLSSFNNDLTSAASLATVGTITTGVWQATDVGVAYGGTGASSFTDAGVLIGNGTGAIQVTSAGTSGQVLTSNGAGVDPTFQNAAGGADIQVFTGSGTWTKPSGSPSVVKVIMRGAGGGGGSGGRNAAGNYRGGGSGGAGGGYVERTFQASELGATETVTVGAGGTGGAAQTSDSSSGNAGADGGDTQFGSQEEVFMPGGQGGGGGVHAGGSADLGYAVWDTSNFAAKGINGGARSGGGQLSADLITANGRGNIAAGCGGGGGGGINNSNVDCAGGGGGLSNDSSGSSVHTIDNGGGAAGGAAGGSAGSNASTPFGGGGAGGGNASGAGGAGGDGDAISGGGGGGGASVNGSNSGAGGDGGDGLVVVITW